MKLSITGACHFVNRMFEACGTFQWAREFLMNSIEANATRVEFGIEWQAVERMGSTVAQLLIMRDGMDWRGIDPLLFNPRSRREKNRRNP